MRFGIFLTLALTVLGGCGSSSSSRPVQNPDPVDLTQVVFELVHASQDAPPVNLTVGGSSIASGADFGQAAFVTTTAGEITVEVEGIIPSGNATVITRTADFADGQRVTIFATDEVANIDGAVSPIIIIDDQPEIAPTEVRLRLVHAASNVTAIAPMVDVYISGPTDPLPAAPTTTFMFGDVVELAAPVPAGDYRVRVTPSTSTTVVYDSGTLPLAGGSDLVVAAIANVGPGAAPIQLLALTGSEALSLPSAGDVPTPADLRVGHIAADVVPVDVIANDDLVNRPVEDLEYGDVTDYLPIPAGPINFKVVGAGTDGPAAIDTLDTVDLVSGTTYSVFAVGLANADPASDEALTARIYEDNPRRISTEGRARIFHGSPSAGPVDIYVVETGTDITDLTADFSGVEFLGETGYVSLEVGVDYDVIVTGPGSKTPAIPVVTIPLDIGVGGGVEGDTIYTAIAADAPGGGAPMGLILADDLDP